MEIPPLPGLKQPAPKEEPPSSGTSPVLLALIVVPILAAAYYFMTKPAPVPKPGEMQDASPVPARPAPPAKAPVETAPKARETSSLEMLRGGSELMQDAQPQASPAVKASAPTPSSKKAASRDPKKKAQLKTIDKNGTGSNWSWER